jgi:DNA-binding ferritin-like protein
MNLNLTVLFTVLNTLKIDHWQTSSFAEHKALGTAYKKLDGLFDTFVEHFYGIAGFPNSEVSYKITLSSYSDNLIAKYNNIRKEVVGYLQSAANNSGDLKNICDEIEGEFNHLLYRLNQK